MSSIKEKVATVSGLDSVRYELNLFWDLLNETNRGSDAKARSLIILTCWGLPTSRGADSKRESIPCKHWGRFAQW